jgi:hypothetical protein
VIGHRDDTCGVDHDVLLPGTREPDGDHALADRDVLDAVAERVDDADTLHAQHRRELRREPVAATDDVQIGGVNRRGLHPHADLAGLGLGRGTGLQAQHVRRLADGVHDEGLHGGHRLPADELDCIMQAKLRTQLA